MKPRILLSVPLSVATMLAVSSCAGTTGDTAASSGDPAAPAVLTSFYPLQYVAEKVGGDLVQVSSLTPPGAEPHGLELSPNAVSELDVADLVVYLSGFQPAVDEAVERTTPGHVVDAAAAAGIRAGNGDGAAGSEDHSGHDHSGHDHAGGEGIAGKVGESGHDHAEESVADEDGHAGHDHGGADPHFWLDPERLTDVAHEVAHELGAVDPANAEAYEANAVALTQELVELDEEFTQGLGSCERDTIVVSHEAYGFLAEKYGLEQVGIAGLEPESEPSPARLAEIGGVVKAEGVTTVFSESLVNPKVAQTLADDLGITTAVLDPVETHAAEGKDYQQVMRGNLAALQKGLGCN